MFISSKGSIYFQEGESFFEVKKSCEKLIISSTSTNKVEVIDRVFETNEILRKTNSQFVEREIEKPEAIEIIEAVEAVEDIEEVVEVVEVVKEKPKQGRPAEKTKKVEAK